MSRSLDLSVIIPTYNRAHLITRCLEALVRQSAPGVAWEVLVVDDGSTDGTRDRLDGSSWPFPFTYLRKPNGGCGSARNLGVAHARGRWIAFTDDDCLPRPDWVTSIIAACRARPDLAGLGGPIEPADLGNLIARYITARRLLAGPAVTDGRVVNLPGANAIYRRDAFERVGGYDEWFRLPGGEDVDLNHRLLRAGERLGFEPSVVVQHAHREDVRALARQAYWYGHASGLLNVRTSRRRRPRARMTQLVAAAVYLVMMPLYAARHLASGTGLVEGTAYGLLDGVRKAAYAVGKGRGLAARPD